MPAARFWMPSLSGVLALRVTLHPWAAETRPCVLLETLPTRQRLFAYTTVRLFVPIAFQLLLHQLK